MIAERKKKKHNKNPELASTTEVCGVCVVVCGARMTSKKEGNNSHS